MQHMRKPSKTRPIFGQRKQVDFSEDYQFFSQNFIDNLLVFVYNANCSFYMSSLLINFANKNIFMT